MPESSESESASSDESSPGFCLTPVVLVGMLFFAGTGEKGGIHRARFGITPPPPPDFTVSEGLLPDPLVAGELQQKTGRQPEPCRHQDPCNAMVLPMAHL